MSDENDIRSSLADMDRKLRELQRELEMVAAPAEEPEPSPPPPAPAPAPAPVPPPAPAPAASNTPAWSDAQADAARIIDEAAACVTELGRQVDDLQRLRDALQQATAALAQEYHRAFDAPAPGAPAFEGDVVINAGPFRDIRTLGSLEQALTKLPRAADVYVRSYEGDRALIDLRLAGAIDLVDEMRRAIPFTFDVVEIGPGRVTINFDPPARAAPAATPGI